MHTHGMLAMDLHTLAHNSFKKISKSIRTCQPCPHRMEYFSFFFPPTTQSTLCRTMGGPGLHAVPWHLKAKTRH